MAKTFTEKEWRDMEEQVRKSRIYCRGVWVVVELLRLLKKEVEWLEKEGNK